jgi:hypothetical protein
MAIGKGMENGGGLGNDLGKLYYMSPDNLDMKKQLGIE